MKKDEKIKELKIYFIRHGESMSNKKGLIVGQSYSSLSNFGRKQVLKINTASFKKVSSIYSSDLDRCVETAQIINKKLQLPLFLDARLREKSLGSLEGKKIDSQSFEYEQDEKCKYDYRSYGGENSTQVKERLFSFIRDILDTDQQLIIVVTSKGIIKLLYLLLQNKYKINIKNGSSHLFSFSKGMEMKKNIKIKLQEEFKKSRALVTNALVACALVTEKSIYYGHNSEEKGQNTSEFIHAESNALEKMLLLEKKPLIKEIYMIGGGIIKKFKNYTPCCDCIDNLKKYVTKKTLINLLPLRKGKGSLKLFFSEVLKAQKKFSYSKFNIKNIDKQLKKKTLLKEVDRVFVSRLADQVKSIFASLYITGSSSGRGAVSNLIMKKTGKNYNDIDLIVVVQKNQLKSFESELDFNIKSIYSGFDKKNKLVLAHKNRKKVVIKNIIYTLPSKNKIDITFAENIDGAFRQLPYEERNWFHQII